MRYALTAVLIATSLALSGCSAARVLFLPGKCHPDELVRTADGSFIASPNPCRVPGPY